jgi:hypothetical protein
MAIKSDRPTYAVEAIPSDVKDAVFLGNPILDNVVASIIAMGSELWATQRRLKVMESVMAKNGISPQAIEQYVPTPQEAAAWEKDRDRFIDLAFGPLGNDANQSYSADFPKRDKATQ